MHYFEFAVSSFFFYLQLVFSQFINEEMWFEKITLFRIFCLNFHAYSFLLFSVGSEVEVSKV